MATSLTTQTRAFFFSSELHDLAWSTDQQEVHVRLYYQHTGNMLADVTLTASGGRVTLYETREIVERYMRMRTEGNKFDLWDFLATCLGAVLVALFIIGMHYGKG